MLVYVTHGVHVVLHVDQKDRTTICQLLALTKVLVELTCDSFSILDCYHLSQSQCDERVMYMNAGMTIQTCVVIY